MDATALQKIALTAIVDQTNNFITARPAAKRRACRIAFLTDASGNVSVFGADANRDEDISRNGSSGFDGNADSAEVAGLAAHAITVGDSSAELVAYVPPLCLCFVRRCRNYVEVR